MHKHVRVDIGFLFAISGNGIWLHASSVPEHAHAKYIRIKETISYWHEAFINNITGVSTLNTYVSHFVYRPWPCVVHRILYFYGVVWCRLYETHSSVFLDDRVQKWLAIVSHACNPPVGLSANDSTSAAIRTSSL